MPAQQIASQLFKQKGFGIGRIRAWGAEVVRPDDVFYELRGADADGDLLRLSLAINPMPGNENPPLAWLVIDKPGHLKVSGEAIQIAGGDYLRFEEQVFAPRPSGKIRAIRLGREEDLFDAGAAVVLELVKHRDA